jgi:hypothetical protein
VLTPAGALSGITTISLPSVAAAAAVSTIYKAVSSPDNTITSWGDGSGWRFNFLGNAARTSNVLTLVDNGNVGINCNAPAYTLDVNGNTKTSNMYVYGNPANAGVARIILGPNPAAGNLDYCSMIESSNSNAGNYQSWLKFYTHDGASSGGDPTLRMSIDNIGRVGIGQANPGYTLDVGGNSRILCNANTSTSSFGTTNETLSLMSPCNGYTGGVASIYFGNATANYPLARIYAQDSSTGGNYRSRLVFQTNADSSSLAERMRIEAGGNVGINCNAPAYTLDVKGSINTASQFIANADATNTNPLSLANNAASGSLLQILQTGTTGGWLNNCVAGDTSIRSFGKLLLAAGSTSGTGILNASIILGNSNYCVGIGSNVNPSSTLDVVGTTRLTTASSLASTAPDGGANHGLMLVSTKAPDSGKTAYSMALGVDSGTGYGYINAAGNTALQPILLQSRGGGVGIGLTTAPAYTLDVGGITNVGPASGGTIYVGTSNGLVVQGASNGHGYIRADTSTTSSDKILYLGTGQSNNVEINRTNVVFNVSNVVQVYGNLATSGTSYLNDISNTNVYATGGLFSGTIAGRLVMVGTGNACYIEAGLNSDTGSAAPLYFTDMYNAHQWMCIGSTGNIGMGTNSPGTKLDVSGSVRWAQGSGDTSQIFSTSNGNFNFGAQNAYDPTVYGIVQITHQLSNKGGVGAADGQWAYTMVQSGTRVNGIGMMPSLGKIVIGSGSSVLEGSSNGITVDVTNKRLGIACNAPAYSLDVIGTINATGDVIAYSDARAKTNVATISNALSKVNAMRGVTYAMKTEPDVQKIGVIAQEVEQIIPELVSTDSTPEQKKSVAYGNITAVLIEAIKELTKRLETLERR